jgi:hypothetical protein
LAVSSPGNAIPPNGVSPLRQSGDSSHGTAGMEMTWRFGQGGRMLATLNVRTLQDGTQKVF